MSFRAQVACLPAGRRDLFFLIFILLYAGIFLFSRLNQQRFDADLLETMITQQGKYQGVSADPCLHTIAGDPNSAGNQYAKLRLVCSATRDTVASLDLRAVKGAAWVDLIAELAHLNNFYQSTDKSGLILGSPPQIYRCFVEETEITDLHLPIVPRAILNCFNADLTSEINAYLSSWSN